MQFQPFIVTGVGRSGTTAMVHRLLQAGVFMGPDIESVNPLNPNGRTEIAGGEDVNFRDTTRRFLTGTIRELDWQDEITQLVKLRNARQVPWGWKDTQLSECLVELVELLPEAIYLWCRRPREAIVLSLMRVYGHGRKQAEEFHDRRDDYLEQNFPKSGMEVWVDLPNGS